MNRALAVMRMHLVDRLTLVVMPLGILASAFAVNVVIWLPLGEDDRRTWGALALPVFVLAAAVFAVLRGLPFALGMGVTRRAFVIGTAMTGGVLAVGFGTLYAVLGAVERWTDGWGLNGTFFDYPFVADAAWPVTWLVLIAGFATAWMAGTALAALWPRWGMLALALGAPAAILVLGGAIAVVTWQDWWGAVGGWLTRLEPLTLAGWLLAATIVLAFATWGSLRRVSLR